MSIERDVQTPGGQTVKFTKDMTKEEIRALYNVEVLDRAIINDRLDMTKIIPAHLHGEWVHIDDIPEKLALGFEVDTEHGKSRGLHNDGTGRTQTGDVVFMTCHKHVKEIIDENRLERYNKMHGLAGDRPTEESNFVAETLKEDRLGEYVKTTNNSNTVVRAGDDLKAQIPST